MGLEWDGAAAAPSVALRASLRSRRPRAVVAMINLLPLRVLPMSPV